MSVVFVLYKSLPGLTVSLHFRQSPLHKIQLLELRRGDHSVSQRRSMRMNRVCGLALGMVLILASHDALGQHGGQGGGGGSRGGAPRGTGSTRDSSLQDFKFLSRADDKHISAKIHRVDFAVRPGGRRLDLRPALQVAVPQQFP